MKIEKSPNIHLIKNALERLTVLKIFSISV